MRLEREGRPEVEEHDAPHALDEHVRQLDVAMDASGAVKRVDRLGELGERAPDLLDSVLMIGLDRAGCPSSSSDAEPSDSSIGLP